MRLLLLVLLSACSAPAKPAMHPNAESVSVVDDAVYRVEPDGTISVVVHVNFEGLTAPGTVRFWGADLTTAPTSKHLRYARARGWQALAELAKTPTVAFDAAVRGVNEIEGAYSIRGLHDDSSRTLRMLQAQREAGAEHIDEVAARAKQILARKLQHYAKAWRPELR
jgi:hypothetical protein